MDTESAPNEFKDFCPRCAHFEEETGVCKKILQNVREYPKKFVKRCNGEYYEYDPDKIVEEPEEVEENELTDDNSELLTQSAIYASHETTTSARSQALTAFFSFRQMVSNQIIKVLYLLGVIVLTVGGLAGIASGEDEGVALGLGAITIGNLLWRLVCEGWILLFSIHEILGSIEKLQREKT